MKYWLTIVLLFFLILFPVIVVVISAFGSGNSLEFPPNNFSIEYFTGLFTQSDWINSLVTSLKLSSLSVVIAVPIGASIVLLQKFYLKNSYSKLITFFSSLPLAIPPILLGIGFFKLTRLIGLEGNWVTLGLINSFIGIPVTILILSIAMRKFPYEIMEAAATCGAKPKKIFTTVILPFLAPSLLTSSIIIFMLSMEELVIALYVAQPTAMPISVKFWSSIKYYITPFVTSAATILILIYFIVLLLSRNVFTKKYSGNA